MAKVQVLNVAVLDNPSPFGNPFQFEITFECMEDLPEDLEWKIIYVGSAESEEYDQTLDSVLVGPVPAGRHMFVFQADAPNTGLIPESDAVGVTVVLITCTYRGQEFIRIGYYVNNEYTDPELRENPPIKPAYSQLQRNILASNPRVTRFHINWEMSTDKMEDSENVDPAPNTMLPPTCLPGKAPPLGLMPDNSMDSVWTRLGGLTTFVCSTYRMSSCSLEGSEEPLQELGSSAVFCDSTKQLWKRTTFSSSSQSSFTPFDSALTDQSRGSVPVPAPNRCAPFGLRRLEWTNGVRLWAGLAVSPPPPCYFSRSVCAETRAAPGGEISRSPGEPRRVCGGFDRSVTRGIRLEGSGARAPGVGGARSGSCRGARAGWRASEPGLMQMQTGGRPRL
ncbi:hypothetical protein AOLI_G00235230 [Acnodon oligacanthus]